MSSTNVRSVFCLLLGVLLVLALGAAQANGQVWLPLQGSVE